MSSKRFYCLFSFTENLKMIKIVNAQNTKRARIKLFTLFFYIPVLHKDDVKKILEFLNNCEDKIVLSDLKEVLRLR